MKIQIAMAGLFGSLFFSLLPMYDILLQQNNSLHPLIWIISLLLLPIIVISALITSKKIAYASHNLSLKQKNHSLHQLPAKEKKLLHLLFISTIVLFALFLYLKIMVLRSVSFFFQALFGTPMSILLSILFFMILIWSSYTLIRTHLDDQYPNIHVSFWGKHSTNL